MNNNKRCVIVTGGSRGIGRACVDVLLAAGYTTVTLARRAPSPAITGNHHYSIDLSDLSAGENLIKELLRKHPVSGLVCNAGRGDIGSLENFSTHQIEQSVRLNLISPLCLARHCLPALRQCQRSDLVFIGSTSALHGARYGSVYSASKFGLRGIAQSLAHELAGANCHVGIVQPGMVRTDFFKELDFEPGSLAAHALLASDVANAVLSLFQAPEHAVISEIVVQPRQHVVQKRRHDG